MSAELDATTALQMEADANPILQADGGKRVIIAATYRSWKEEGVNRLERDFVIDETGADELGEEGDLHDKDTDGRRRLSESALSATASGATFSSSSITSFSRPYTYTLEAQVGTGRYDGTRNEVTVKLFGSGGKESNFLNLGQGLKKGEKRIVEGEQPCPILSPTLKKKKSNQTKNNIILFHSRSCRHIRHLEHREDCPHHERKGWPAIFLHQDRQTDHWQEQGI